MSYAALKQKQLQRNLNDCKDNRVLWFSSLCSFLLCIRCFTNNLRGLIRHIRQLLGLWWIIANELAPGADEWEIENPRLVSTCYQLIRANWVVRAAAPVGLPDGRRWSTPSLWDGRPLTSLCIVVPAQRCLCLWYPTSKEAHTGTQHTPLLSWGGFINPFPNCARLAESAPCCPTPVGLYGTLGHHGHSDLHNKMSDSRLSWGCSLHCLPFSVAHEPTSSSLKRDSHEQRASKQNPGLWELTGGQEEAIKCSSQVTTALEIFLTTPSQCSASAATLPISAGEGERSLWPAVNHRQDGVYENHLDIQMHGPSFSCLHFKRCGFPFAFSSTFLLQPRRVWRVFATFRLLTAALCSHGYDLPASQPAPNQAFLPRWQASARTQG